MATVSAACSAASMPKREGIDMSRHLTTRLAVRALFAIVMQTEVHAAELVPPAWRNPMLCTQTGNVLSCEHYEREVRSDRWVLRPVHEASPSTCAPGHEQACQQRDHGASPYQGMGR
jgi:hypothetical protein